MLAYFFRRVLATIPVVLMVALFVLPVLGINLFGWIVGIPVDFLMQLVYRATGLA